MKSYNIPTQRGSRLKSVEITEGITIETQIARIIANNSTDISEKTPIYTERREGVLAGFNVRNDKWDTAIDAMDKASRIAVGKRTPMKVIKEDSDNTETVQATNEQS